MKCILVDDELLGLTSLQRLLDVHCPQVEIMEKCRRADDAIIAIERHKPDLLFLDIAMPGKSGFDMLREIGDINFEIIFVTAYDQFITQALHLSAVDYLMKPVEGNVLVEAVKRAETKINHKADKQPFETLMYNVQQPGINQKMKLCIPSMKGFQVVEIQKIIYIEASSNYSNFHFTDKPLICASKPMHEYATLLEDCNFVRIHKSYVVNLDHVTEYVKGEGGNVILTGGIEIEVSRRRKDLLMNKMKGYYKY